MADIAILGAGLKGLKLAHDFEKKGHRCTILESANQVGGALISKRHASGYLTEDGAHTFLMNAQSIESFIHSIPGLSETLIEANPASQNRFILRNEILHAIKPKVSSIVKSKLLSAQGKLAILKDLFAPRMDRDEDISLHDFFEAHFGKELADYLLNAFIAGTYAGDPKKLSAEATFPRLVEYEKTKGSILRSVASKKKLYNSRIISFKNGLMTLPIAISQLLENQPILNCEIQHIKSTQNKWEIAYRSPDQRSIVRSFDRIYCTIPAHKISKLPLEPRIQNQLPNFDSIYHPPVAVLSLGFHNSQIKKPLDGFGYLIPELEKQNYLGGLFISSLFENRAPKDHQLFTFFIGGARSPELAIDDKDQLIANTLPSIQKLLNISGSPTFSYSRYWSHSIPQYSVGYKNTLKSIEAFESAHPNFHFSGNYRGGISLADSVRTL